MDEVENIKEFYHSFFSNCETTECCNQYNLIEGYDRQKDEDPRVHLYNNALLYTEEYFNNDKRILIVGQERSGKPLHNPEIITEPIYIWNNIHWRATLFTSIKFNMDISIDDMLYMENNVEKKKENERLIVYENLKFDFAFTNYYKCGFSKNGEHKSGKNIHTKEIKENCYYCFIKEIDYLKPNVIVIQGHFMPDKLFEDLEIINKYENVDVYLWRNKNAYVITTYHPAYQKCNWFKYRKSLYNVIDKYKFYL